MSASTAAGLPASAPSCRLRVVHEGLLSLRLERRGRLLRFNPRHPPDDDDIVVLDWSWPEHLAATAAAIAAGRRFDVIAPEPVLGWIRAMGGAPARMHALGGELDGLRVVQQPYRPIPWATPLEGARKLRSALLRPGRAIRRLAHHRGLPAALPHITAVRLADGGRLLHLNLSLHRGTPDPWLSRVVEDHAGVDWLLVGCDFQEDDAVVERVPALRAGTVLIVDLLSELRRSIGMPTALLTPVADRLRQDGVEAHVLAAHTSVRFDGVGGATGPGRDPGAMNGPAVRSSR